MLCLLGHLLRRSVVERWGGMRGQHDEGRIMTASNQAGKIECCSQLPPSEREATTARRELFKPKDYSYRLLTAPPTPVLSKINVLVLHS